MSKFNISPTTPNKVTIEGVDNKITVKDDYKHVNVDIDQNITEVVTVGAYGVVGATGFKGKTGPQGPQGPQGSQGPTGATGIQGVTGPTGAGTTGATGIQGIQGVTGPTGVGTTGATGPQGPPGPASTQGATGATGTIGTTGATGPQGPSFPYTGDAIISGSLNITGSLTASGLNYPTVDGDEKQVIITDGEGNLYFDWADRTNIDVKNTSGTPLELGTPVYISGFQGASIFQVSPSSASLSNTMPAVGILDQDLAINEQGHATILGALRGYDTSLLNVNDSLYVGEGILTKDRPTGSALIQKIARVGNSQNNGELTVIGAGRTNDVPNLQPGYLWVGDSDWKATPIPTSSISGGGGGATGATGIPGTQGTTGATGLQGTQGIQGTQGTTGATGLQGTQGIQGTTGATGLQGTQGTQGTTGATGLQGTQGIQGITGPQGTQGTTGATGPQGTQGIQGTTGATGPQGTQGATGLGTTGATGPEGPIGATGPAGGGGNTFPYTGDAEITGSLGITNNLEVNNQITSSNGIKVEAGGINVIGDSSIVSFAGANLVVGSTTAGSGQLKLHRTGIGEVTIEHVVREGGNTLGLTLAAADFGPGQDFDSLYLQGGGSTILSFNGGSSFDNSLTLGDSTVTVVNITTDLRVTGNEIDFTNLPSTDPGVAGRLFTTQSANTGGNLDGQLVVLVSQG
jgi:hypothetical protein